MLNKSERDCSYSSVLNKRSTGGVAAWKQVLVVDDSGMRNGAADGTHTYQS